MVLGPVEWIEIGFPGSKLNASIVPALRKLVDSGTIRQAQVDAQVAAALAQQQAPEAPAAVAPAAGLSAESIATLQQLGDLLRQGILTEEEFAAQKARVLGA